MPVFVLLVTGTAPEGAPELAAAEFLEELQAVDGVISDAHVRYIGLSGDFGRYVDLLGGLDG